MWVIERKNILTIVLVVVLVVAGYLNIRSNMRAAQEASATQEEQTQGTVPGDETQGEEIQGDEMPNDHVKFVSGEPANFFEDFKVKRETTRREEIEYVRSILNQESLDEAQIAQAQDKIFAITDGMEKELTVEGLLESKGFFPVVAVFHPGSANIIIGAESLTEEEVAQIADIVVRETGVGIADINIIPYYGQ
jgi:stage III sporulation protein AH